VATSGETAKATVNNDPITLIDAIPGRVFRQITIINESGVAGSYSLDGGTEWCRWPTGAKSLTLDAAVYNEAVMFKRVADGSDVTGLWASMN
jgi:hypothetical protein